MQYTIIPVTSFSQNCTVLWCQNTQEAVIVDPGGEPDRIIQLIERQRLKPVAILLTHGHLDHVGASVMLNKKLNIPIKGPHIADRFWLFAIEEQCKLFGFPHHPNFIPDQWLNHGDIIEFGEQTLQVLHCPGHTPGHVVFFHQIDKLALVGDVLFNGSIGRTDFPKGDYDTLIRSIKEQLWPLGDDVQFIPGHGEMSNFGEERRYNPYVCDRN
jgi:hydroxyacylglutathione hydrolase